MFLVLGHKNQIMPQKTKKAIKEKTLLLPPCANALTKVFKLFIIFFTP